MSYRAKVQGEDWSLSGKSKEGEFLEITVMGRNEGIFLAVAPPLEDKVDRMTVYRIDRKTRLKSYLCSLSYFAPKPGKRKSNRRKKK